MNDLSAAIERVRTQLEQLPGAPSIALHHGAQGIPSASLLHVQWVLRSLLSEGRSVSIRSRDLTHGAPPAPWVEVELSGGNPTPQRFDTVRELVVRGGGELHEQSSVLRLLLPCRAGETGNAAGHPVTPTPTVPFARLLRAEPAAPAHCSQEVPLTSGPGA